MSEGFDQLKHKLTEALFNATSSEEALDVMSKGGTALKELNFTEGQQAAQAGFAGITSRSQFKSVKEKTEFIKAFGGEAYNALSN